MAFRTATSAMALLHSLQLQSSLLEKPAPEPVDVLVYGGATSTGTMAIQLLERCGLRVITTCSPRNFGLVRVYGADECLDYKSPTCGADIRSFTCNALEHTLDCITEESTMKTCYQALGRCDGKCTPSLPLFHSTPQLKPSRRNLRTLSRTISYPSHYSTGLGSSHVDDGSAYQLARAVRYQGG